MARTSWQVMWVLVALSAVAASVVSARHAHSSGDLFTLTAILAEGVGSGLVCLLMLAPLLCLGAWVRSKVRRGTTEDALAAPPLPTPPPAADERLTPEQQELVRRMRAVAEASPPPVLRPDLIPRWRVAALVVWAVVFSATALVCLLAINNAAPARRWTTRMSGDDKLELERMLTSVMQEPDSVDEVKPRFWKWIDAHGGMSDADLDAFRAEKLTDLHAPRLYWEDALLTLERGKALKSAERARLEADLIAQGKMSDWERQQDEADMEHIAAGKPIPVIGKEVVITREMARAKLADCERQREAVAQLLTPPAGWRPLPLEEWPPSHGERGEGKGERRRERGESPFPPAGAPRRYRMCIELCHDGDRHTSRNRIWM